MEPLLVFSKGTITERSNTTSEIDVLATPSSNLMHIGATLGEIIIFFRNNNLFSDDSIAGGASTKAADFTRVALRVRAGNETNTIERFHQTVKNAQGTGQILQFKNELKKYDVKGILEVVSITRTDLPTDDDIYLSCGTGGSSTDIDPGVVDVANDSFLFYDSDDEGLPKVETISDFVAAIAGDNLTAVNGVLNAPAFSIPGGDKYAVLAKLSDTDDDYGWTETPQFEQLSISRWSSTEDPLLNFHYSRGTDHTETTTLQGDILGQIGFTGVNQNNSLAEGGKIVFTQTQDADTSKNLQTKFELFVGTAAGDQVALTANEERVISIPNLTTTPTAVQGGIYANNSDILFFGVG